MSHILVVEDEELIASFVAKGLRAAGYDVRVETTGRGAISMALTGFYDLAILDVGLPDIDGFAVLEQLRGQGVTMPIIMLTARASVTDRVAGLRGGADDYMSKPFAFDELLARVQLRLRAAHTQAAAQQTAGDTVLTVGDLTLNLLTRQLTVNGEEVDLSGREFSLAETFFRNAGQILSREQLLSAAWGYDFDPGSNVVDVYVRYLRNKIGADHFETVRGMGYRFK